MYRTEHKYNKEVVLHLRFISFVCLLVFGTIAYGFISSFTHEKWPENFLKKANIYHDNYQFEKLKEYSLERIKSHPKDANGPWYLGLAYQHFKQYSKAIKQYEKAILLTNNLDHMETLNKNIKQCKERLEKYGEVTEPLQPHGN